jgi:hypothetical protein
MKFIVAVALALCLRGAAPAQSPIVFFEDFSDNSAGWTLGSVAGSAWQIGPAVGFSHGYYNPSTGVTTTYSDPANDAYGVPGGGVAGTMIGGGVPSASCTPAYYLTSPAVDLTGLSAVNLSFQRVLANFDSYVQNSFVEVWNGTAWVQIWQAVENNGLVFGNNSWTLQTFDVSAYVNAAFKVRFGHVGTSPSFVCSTLASLPGWTVDNVALVVPGPPNDLCAGALPLLPGSNVASLHGATATSASALAPICGLAGTLPDVWFQYTPTDDVVANFARFGGNGMALYQGPCAGLALLPAYCGNAQTFHHVLLNAGTTYLLRVGSPANTTPTIAFEIFDPLQTIGVGCPSATTLTGTVPALGAVGTITLQAQPFAFGALLLSPPNLAGAYTPFGPCTLYVQNPATILMSFATDANGVWSLSIPFPSDPSWELFSVDMQCLAFGPAGIEASNGLRIVMF